MSLTFTTGNTFINGDSATATKLDNMVNLATYTGVLEVTAGGTGVAASTGTGSSVLNTSPTLITPALGTPASGVLTNCTGLPVANLTGTAAIAQGGTSSTSSAAANQNLTPATVIVTESAGAATVNWASGAAYFLTLNANCTISFSNQVDGQVITVLILNTASNWTVTWPAGVKWASASAPVQTVGAHYDLYSLIYNNTVGATFGTYVQNY